MLIITSLNSFAQFTGGNADGYSDAILAQSNCTPIISNFVFYGGNSDGYNDGMLTQSNCTPIISDFVYYGGNADGYNDVALTQSNCPTIVSNFVFYGGNADGYSDAAITQSNCPTIVSNFVFYGGNADGYSDAVISQSNCTPIISNFVFYGGRADGFSYSIKQQTPCSSILVLPIELLSFTAEKNKSIVDIKWITASEINNDYFTVERSQDGTNFSSISIVPGSENSTTEKNYIVKDNFPYNGISYYRLKQTDFNGRTKYSKIETVDYLVDDYGISIYPNPTHDYIIINFSEKLNLEPSSISLTNVYGKKLEHYETISKNQIKVDLSHFPSGIYFIAINVGKEVIEHKIMLQK
jgi:hypothetical protein